jgi:hypothetical protein
MKQLALILSLLVASIVVPAGPSAAWTGHGGGWHGAVIIGAPWLGYPYAYPYGYGGYYPPSYPAYPPVVDQGASVYIQQQSVPSETTVSTDWYYCSSSGAYYPNVPTCSESWVRVPSTPQ